MKEGWWLREHSGVGSRVLTDRFGLYNLLSSEDVPPQEASDFNHVYAKLDIGLR